MPKENTPKKTPSKINSKIAKPANKKTPAKKTLAKNKKTPIKKIASQAREKKQIKIISPEANYFNYQREPEPKDVKKQNVSEEPKDRVLLMWAGVTFFMILIFFAWVMNTKKIFQENRVDYSENSSNWFESKEGLSETINLLKEGLEEIKEMRQDLSTESQDQGAENSAPSSEIFDEFATSSETIDENKSDQLNQEELEELKKKLKEIEARLNKEDSISE